MKLTERHPLSAPNTRRQRARFVGPICLIWVVASIIGFAVQAFAATPTGLRGNQSSALPPVPVGALSAQNWLGASIWRAGPCDSALNFQAFTFSATAPKVEVGSGKPGDGERLELLRVSTDPTGLIQIETRVCAPVGCNQTVERYKKLGPNQMQEWHFEGRLPDHVPYVIVANGTAVDGSGPGRVFNRCVG